MESPEMQKAWGQILLVIIGFLTFLVLIASVYTSDYIFITGWIAGLLIFGILCVIYGIIAIGFAKTIFAI
ncbi:MAG: hypothetical protein WCP55_18865, partial [Lentisphaerota bacterium]